MRPSWGFAGGGTTIVGCPGPFGLSPGLLPVALPSGLVPVSLSSVTGVPEGGVPPAVAVFAKVAGAPAAFGSTLTVKVTLNESVGSRRPSVPVIRADPAASPVNAPALLDGATALPELLFVSMTTGAVTTPLKALPSCVLLDRSSMSVNGVSPTLPVFSTVTV